MKSPAIRFESPASQLVRASWQWDHLHWPNCIYCRWHLAVIWACVLSRPRYILHYSLLFGQNFYIVQSILSKNTTLGVQMYVFSVWLSFFSVTLARTESCMYFRVFIIAASSSWYWTRIPLIGLVFGPSHFFHSQRLLTWQTHTQEMTAVWCLVCQLCLVFPLRDNHTVSFRRNTFFLPGKSRFFSIHVENLQFTTWMSTNYVQSYWS